MTTQSRKQSDFIKRENLFIQNARKLLMSDGLEAVSMERVAEISQYSKGTIYKHFSCKEDLYCAISTIGLSYLLDLCETAYLFEGRSRERFIALLVAYRLYSERNPQELEVILAARSATSYDKASTKFRQQHEQYQLKIDVIAKEVVRKGAENGDIKTSDPNIADNIILGVWALSIGTDTLFKAPDLIKHLNLADSKITRLNQVQRLLDGYLWHPLSEEWNYADTIQKAYRLISQKHPLSQTPSPTLNLEPVVDRSKYG